MNPSWPNLSKLQIDLNCLLFILKKTLKIKFHKCKNKILNTLNKSIFEFLRFNKKLVQVQVTYYKKKV